jgi:hypothetical protein
MPVAPHIDRAYDEAWKKLERLLRDDLFMGSDQRRNIRLHTEKQFLEGNNEFKGTTAEDSIKLGNNKFYNGKGLQVLVDAYKALASKAARLTTQENYDTEVIERTLHDHIDRGLTEETPVPAKQLEAAPPPTPIAPKTRILPETPTLDSNLADIASLGGSTKETSVPAKQLEAALPPTPIAPKTRILPETPTLDSNLADIASLGGSTRETPVPAKQLEAAPPPTPIAPKTRILPETPTLDSNKVSGAATASHQNDVMPIESVADPVKPPPELLHQSPTHSAVNHEIKSSPTPAAGEATLSFRERFSNLHPVGRGVAIAVGGAAVVAGVGFLAHEMMRRHKAKLQAQEGAKDDTLAR